MKRVQVCAILSIVALLAFLFPKTALAAEPPVKLAIGGSGATSWGIGPIAPGQSGIKTVTVQNIGAGTGNLSIWLSDIRNIEGTPETFETHTPGDIGELGSFLTLSVNCTGINTNVRFPALVDDFPQSASDTKYIRVASLNSQQTVTLEWRWDLPSKTGNIVQGDSISFNIVYLLEELPPPSPTGTPGGGGGTSGGGGGGFARPTSTSRFVEIDFLGEKTRADISQDGKLLKSYIGVSSDRSLTFSLGQGTSIGYEGKDPPAKIKIGVYPESVPTGENEYLIGDVYSIDGFSTDGTWMDLTFSPAFEVVFNYKPEDVRSDSTGVHLYTLDGGTGQWARMQSPDGYQPVQWQVSAVGGRTLIFATIANVSRAAPYTASPGRIEVHNLTVTPATLTLGQTVTVRGEAVNVGWSAVEEDIVFSVSGALQNSRKVWLAPGQRRELTYSLTPTVRGKYDVQLGEAKTTFVVTVKSSAAASIAAAIFPLPGSRSAQQWWMMSFIAMIAVLGFMVVAGWRRSQQLALLAVALLDSRSLGRSTSKAALRDLALPSATPRVRKPLMPVVQSITGPTRRLKDSGPYKYSVKVVGGKPPYTVEWRGNGTIVAGKGRLQVELTREETWDSGKGNWVFVTVQDSNGKYSEWVNGDGVKKRLFTYGVTFRGKVITSPPSFPYEAPAGTSATIGSAGKATSPVRKSGVKK